VALAVVALTLTLALSNVKKAREKNAATALLATETIQHGSKSYIPIDPEVSPYLGRRREMGRLWT
jgi:hypothetical protein